MGMPVILEIADPAEKKVFDEIFSYLKFVDRKFSIYKARSEITLINKGKLKIKDSSKDMKTIFQLAEEKRQETSGYFDIYYYGNYDPSGLVKGWVISNVAKKLANKRFKNFYVNVGGDIAVSGKNKQGKPWTIGIRDPFNKDEIVKVVVLRNGGVATSGNYIRGDHIYNPKNNHKIDDIASLTVIGPDIFQADCFATAAFAMGKDGINFIENLANYEGYMIDSKGIATMTSGFEEYVFE